MANLEVKKHMSAWQLAIVVFVTCIGAQIMLTPRGLIAQVKNGAWISVLLGGMFFYTATYFMLRLGKQYPDETIVEYAPRIFGRIGGGFVIFWFNFLFYMQVITIFYGVGRVITFYMFDRTPPEVVILALLVVCTYCALQDWGTILRIQQFLFVIAYSILILVWLTSILNFQPENMLPLWPLDIKGVALGGFSTWGMYSGYECVLLLLPLVYRKISLAKLAKTVGLAFLGLSIVFMLIIVLTIGVLTVEDAKNVPFPSLIVIRSVELPGTFLERLENYLLVTWIPVVFDTLAAMMFFMAEVCMRQWRHADHRPALLILVPIIYVGIMLIDNPQVGEVLGKFTMWLGLTFSFGVVPMALVLTWWQKGKVGKDCG